MANLSLAAVEKLREFTLASDGINARVRDINFRDMVALHEFGAEEVMVRNASAELTDASEPNRYPSVFLFCERMENRLERKFTAFSGTVLLTAEIRVSGESLPGLDGILARYVEAFTDVLAAHHGQWSDNLVYDGNYEARFGQLRLGGVNYLQEARVSLEVTAHA